jgi:hypothetical protein
MTDDHKPTTGDKIKKHFRDHKTPYLVVGTVVVTAVVTAVVTRSVSTNTSIPEVFAQAKNQAVFQWKPVAKVTVKVVRRGHPGLVVRVKGNGVEEVYSSIRRMCEVLDVPRSDFYRYMNGIVDNVKGYTFEVLGEATA